MTLCVLSTDDRINVEASNNRIFLGSGGGNDLITGSESLDIFYWTQDDNFLPVNINVVGYI